MVSQRYACPNLRQVACYRSSICVIEMEQTIHFLLVDMIPHRVRFIPLRSNEFGYYIILQYFVPTYADRDCMHPAIDSR
jgi:hypothetical protein